MILAKIQRYADGKSNDFEIALPTHVTRTGSEDFFALAYHDTNMIIAGMREMDRALGLNVNSRGDQFEVIYRIKAIEDR